jgi:hypothetical protein
MDHMDRLDARVAALRVPRQRDVALPKLRARVTALEAQTAENTALLRTIEESLASQRREGEERA